MALLRRNETMLDAEKVVAFPLSGRKATIRRCARELENVHGDAAVTYWRSECRVLAESLTALGCSEDDVHQQVLTFQTEVQVEMMRRYSDRMAEKTAEMERIVP
ncbi:hypothetical protein QO002_004327 [Pararhizobium capsulatum DSM 1112]|uniref:Uncharacterized protein n=1 Tax=Pararhizobium capsulatum DSM 1112 TaxID=1121113 RepID=A0ABU0BV42_9HYPH|nr:DUF6074 family protein [Pararhizobium capsulatum]MDQ0322121.1 hypothetical protein [Pararhizobium capsulatum DSM 1112]